jgi:hypothetical protein
VSAQRGPARQDHFTIFFVVLLMQLALVAAAAIGIRLISWH